MTQICECHGEPQEFVPDDRYRRGGFYRCRIRAAELKRLAYHDPAKQAQVLRHLQRIQMRYHAQRLAELTERS